MEASNLDAYRIVNGKTKETLQSSDREEENWKTWCRRHTRSGYAQPLDVIIRAGSSFLFPRVPGRKKF